MATTATQFGEGVTFDRPAESITGKRIAQFFFVTFWTIVFTGSIRKWLFPNTSVFYLLQDIPITLAYIYAFFKGAFMRGALLMGVLFLSAILVLQALLQMVAIGLSPIVAFVGLHHYLYYLPMMLIFPLGLTPHYRRTFIRLNLWFALPMLLLSLAQAVSPTSAWINHTSEGDSMGLPGVEVARISGPFNFTSFYGIWIATALSLALGEWLLRREQRTIQSRFLLAASTFSLSLIVLVSGSRANILLCGAAAAGACLAAFLIRSIRAISLIAVMALAAPIVAGVVYVISPTEFNTVYSRFTGDEDDLRMGGRIGEGVYGWLTEPDFSFVGKGIGLGVDAAHFGSSQTGSTQAYDFTYSLSEYDAVRNVKELGTPAGVLFEIIRIGFAVSMILLACRFVYLSPHCLPLACFLLAQVLTDLTRNATMTYTQVMIGYSFIFGVLWHPYDAEPQLIADEPTPAFEPIAGAA